MNRPAAANLPATRRTGLVVALLLLLFAAAALAVDRPIAQACRDSQGTQRSFLPRDLRKFLSLAEVYAHGAGVACILITLLVCDAERRRQWPRLVGAAYGAGLAADAVKLLLVARQRPLAADLEAPITETFVAWFPLFSERFAHSAYSRSFQSFPSAHAATAAGLTVALIQRFPAGRWWFVTLAFCSMAQRVESQAHFPSDVLAGAALGTLIGTWVCSLSWPWSRRADENTGMGVPREGTGMNEKEQD
ncbi:MAG: phosphatase PAP2 family protein [Pirellulales bacterium]